jgi:hypothetical protein
MRSPCRVRPPHTPHGTAAFDARPDLLEVHPEVRVRIKDPRVRLDRLLVFTLGGHSLLSVLPPKKLREPPSALRGAFCHEVTRIDSQCCTLRSLAQKRLGLTQNGKLCFISRQKNSLRFRVAQKDPKLLIAHQKEPDSVRARHSFGRHQNCTALASGRRPELHRDSRAQRLRLIRPSALAVFSSECATFSSWPRLPTRNAF